MLILLQKHNLAAKPQHLTDCPEQNLSVQVESDPCRTSIFPGISLPLVFGSQVLYRGNVLHNERSGAEQLTKMCGWRKKCSLSLKSS